MSVTLDGAVVIMGISFPANVQYLRLSYCVVQLSMSGTHAAVYAIPMLSII